MHMHVQPACNTIISTTLAGRLNVPQSVKTKFCTAVTASCAPSDGKGAHVYNSDIAVTHGVAAVHAVSAHNITNVMHATGHSGQLLVLG
jgi:hypothetical protein